MISNDQFFEITKEIIKNLANEVEKNGNASAYQWNDQLSNMCVSMLMSLTDKMNGPREELMTHLIADLIDKIIKQAHFQVKYDGVSIEDVKKDFKQS